MKLTTLSCLRGIALLQEVNLRTAVLIKTIGFYKFYLILILIQEIPGGT